MSTGKGPRRKKGVWGKIFSVLGTLFVFGMVAGLLGVAVLFSWISRDLPDPNKLVTRKVEKTTKIWDRTGEHLLYEVHGAEKRTLIDLDQIAPVAIQATLATEDKNFYQHGGFRLQSLIRAVGVAVLKGRSVSGTSTITQQLVKNAILSNVRVGLAGITRKIKELVLSYQIEKKFTKDEILQMYFNEIPYGSTAYGIESASQMYFGKNAKDLDIAESALLAAILKRPTRYSPYGTHKDELLWWQRFIIDAMAEQGYVSKEAAETAKAVDIIARIKPRHDAIEAPHFALYIKEQLAEKYGEVEVGEGGLNVTTTLDFDKQKIAEEAVKNGMETIKTFGGSNAALVAIHAPTGQILSMVGSFDYFEPKFGAVNVALRNRQPGSSFKPIAYAAALAKGYTPDTVIFDTNTSFPTEVGKPYEPKNYDGGERGPVTIRKALAGSLNIPAVKALYLVGVETALDLADKMGYTTFSDRSRFGLSLVLGGGEVRLLEHVAAYSIFANEGRILPPVSILKVQDADGNTLEEWKPSENVETALDPEIARQITDILSDNDARSYIFGEKNHLTLVDRMVAAKTGTTNGFHDAWTLGYTPSIVAGVWVGNNDNAAMKNKADGSKIAAPIWNEFMRRATEGMPPEIFTKAQPVLTGKPVLDGRAGEIVVKVDKFSGKLATASTPPGAIEERTYRQTHDILHFVRKDDPRGSAPDDPASDPQYQAWEDGVKAWAEKNGWTETEPPPTETDDAHRPEDAPSVVIVEPSPMSQIPDRVFRVRAQANAPRGIVKRVDFYIEDTLIGTATSAPWETTIVAPATFGKGFYTIKAVAFDDIENYSTSEITVNFQFEPQPLTIEWKRPSADGSFRIRNFPMYIDTVVSDQPSVKSVEIRSASEGGEIVIGTLNRPKTNGVSFTWTDPPAPGTYAFTAIIELIGGLEQRYDGPKITIKE